MILKTELLPHQVKAVEKLSKIKVGALYMEMGTGKTRTALELIANRINAGKVDYILWLCPCSVKGAIELEIRKHTANVPGLTICGIETLSSSIKTRSKLFQLVKEKKVFLIVDESNLVKNHKAERTKAITYLSKNCQYKLILNGTPISRNEADLFAQWYILDWRILGYKSFWAFAHNHVQWDEKIKGRIKDVINVDYLVRKIAPYTYQVKKEDCIQLPDKHYSTYYYNLTEEQNFHYMATADEFLLEVNEMQPHTIYRLFTALQNVISGYWVSSDKGKMNKAPFFDDLVHNPRIKLLLDVISDIDEKMIIFCKYTEEINAIVNLLNDLYGNDSAVAFNGEINHKERQKLIKAFESKSRFFVANKATAGYGLNLQFCRYVIYYSNDWDFATRSQSEDRVHRIGQEKNAHIIDLCAENTLDEQILKCLNRKENLVESFKWHIETMKDKKDMLRWIGGIPNGESVHR